MTSDEMMQKFGDIVETKIKVRLKPIKDSLIRLETQQQELVKQQNALKDQQKVKPKLLNRVAKDVSYISKAFNEEIVKSKKRIKKIENHQGIPQSQ